MKEPPFCTILRAVEFAAHKHRSQRRKDAAESPYINHPITVARLLAEQGGVVNLDVLCAALLHDTIEDTATTADELRESFGACVAAIVLEVTDDKSLPKEKRKQLQIEHAAALSFEAKMVKLADKIANVGDVLHAPPADWSADRRAEYFVWASLVVNGLRGASPTLEAIFDGMIREATDHVSMGEEN